MIGNKTARMESFRDKDRQGRSNISIEFESNHVPYTGFKRKPLGPTLRTHYLKKKIIINNFPNLREMNR